VYVASFSQFSPCDVFVGYHEDAPASICLVYQDNALEKAKTIFLRCATPDAISRLKHMQIFKFNNNNNNKSLFFLQTIKQDITNRYLT
jgi:hypothetical protein